MRDYREMVRSVFDNIDFIAFALDLDGIVVLSEGRGLRAIGFEPGELIGRNVHELYRDQPGNLEQIARARAGEEFTTLNDMGGGLLLESRMAPARSPSGEIIGVVGVSIDVSDQHRAQRELELQTAVLREQAELLDLAHDAIMTRGVDGTIRYWNLGAERLYGYTREEATGRTSHALLRTEFPRPREALDQELHAAGYVELELTHLHKDGRPVVVSSRWVLKRGPQGGADSVLEINTDITARKEAEAAQARRQEEIIRAQALAIEELSTPLIPIADEVLVMPLIGVMDSIRAKQVMETLLSGLAAARGKFAILDITGVPVVDTQVANALIRAAHAARLLGAEVVITGIRPEVAQTLVSIDANLGPVTTRGDLQSGIQYALARRKQLASR